MGSDPGEGVTLSGGSTAIDGWTVTGADIHYYDYYWQASDGTRSLDLDGFNPGGIEQTFATTPGVTYAVTFDMAGNPDNQSQDAVIKHMSVSADDQSTDLFFDVTGHTRSNMGWVKEAWTFTANSTDTTLEFKSLNPSWSGWGPALDNVVVTAINNTAPTAAITGPASGTAFAVGTPVTLTGTFTDPDTADTHAAQWALDNSTITIPGTVTESGGNGTVQTTHTFTTPGVYDVTLTVSDNQGGSGTANMVNGLPARIVVYDPSAGFVTGGGWINSLDPTRTGKANFGFVSKYQKGTTLPTGETEFQVADLNFHSSSSDWLVVNGAKAQYQGSGTINGTGNYGFLLTIIDGQAQGGGGTDKFRMKIWDKANPNTIIYDNQMGAVDSADPTTALGGGSIVLHT